MLEQTQLTLRSPYLDNEIVRTVFRAPRVEQGEDVRLRLIRDGSQALARLRTDRGLGGSNRLTACHQPRLSGIHVQSGICLRLRDAPVGRESGSRFCAASFGASLDGASQALSFSHGGTGLFLQNMFRRCFSTPGRSHVRISIGKQSKQLSRASEGKPQLHDGDSSAPFAGAAAPAFRGRQLTYADLSVVATELAGNESFTRQSYLRVRNCRTFLPRSRQDRSALPKLSGSQSSGYGLVGSRPVSAWFGISPGANVQLDGSPIDAAVFGVLSAAAIGVLIGRGKPDAALAGCKLADLVYFVYCLISVAWSYHPDVSFKRWIKAIGDLAMVLVIVTRQAATSRFWTPCLPRWFPSVPRFGAPHQVLRRPSAEVMHLTGSQ